MGHLFGTEPQPRNGFLPALETILSPSSPQPPQGIGAAFPGARSKSPLVCSILVHLVGLSLVAGMVHQPDRRPVKEVTCWAVNLISVLKEEPRAPVPAPVKPGDLSRSTPAAFRQEDLTPPARKRRPEAELFSFQEFPGTLDAAPGTPASLLDDSPATGGQNTEKPARSFEASLQGQLEAGQALFRMRMGQQLGGAKMKYFCTHLREKVVLLVQNSPSQLADLLRERGASLDVFYRQEGEVERVSPSPGLGETLTDLLESAKWKELPSPVKFGLPFKAVRLAIAVDSEGRVNVSITPL